MDCGDWPNTGMRGMDHIWHQSHRPGHLGGWWCHHSLFRITLACKSPVIPELSLTSFSLSLSQSFPPVHECRCGRRRFLWCLTILHFNHSVTGFSKVWCCHIFLTLLRASCPKHRYQWKGHHAMMNLSILLAFGHEYQYQFYTARINIFQETVSWLGNFFLFP